MPIHKAEAAWHGTFADGQGEMRLGSGAFEGAYSYRSRLEEGLATHPAAPPAGAPAPTARAWRKVWAPTPRSCWVRRTPGAFRCRWRAGFRRRGTPRSASTPKLAFASGAPGRGAPAA